MLKRIPIDQLRLGMHVHSLGGAWLNHPFWKTRFELSDAQDLVRLLESGVPDCLIDTEKGLDVHVIAPQPPQAATTPTPAPPTQAAAAPGIRLRAHPGGQTGQSLPGRGNGDVQ